jgi:hypothetical protein
MITHTNTFAAAPSTTFTHFIVGGSAAGAWFVQEPDGPLDHPSPGQKGCCIAEASSTLKNIIFWKAKIQTFEYPWETAATS